MFLETAEFVTHVSKLTRNMCEMVCHQNRLARNLTMLESLYVPNFVRETNLGSLSSRYQRCHQNYFSSFVGGLPGIEVMFFVFMKLELLLSDRLTIVIFILGRGQC